MIDFCNSNIWVLSFLPRHNWVFVQCRTYTSIQYSLTLSCISASTTHLSRFSISGLFCPVIPLVYPQWRHGCSPAVFSPFLGFFLTCHHHSWFAHRNSFFWPYMCWSSSVSFAASKHLYSLPLSNTNKYSSWAILCTPLCFLQVESLSLGLP